MKNYPPKRAFPASARRRGADSDPRRRPRTRCRRGPGRHLPGDGLALAVGACGEHQRVTPRDRPRDRAEGAERTLARLEDHREAIAGIDRARLRRQVAEMPAGRHRAKRTGPASCRWSSPWQGIRRPPHDGRRRPSLSTARVPPWRASGAAAAPPDGLPNAVKGIARRSGTADGDDGVRSPMARCAPAGRVACAL